MKIQQEEDCEMGYYALHLHTLTVVSSHISVFTQVLPLPWHALTVCSSKSNQKSPFAGTFSESFS